MSFPELEIFFFPSARTASKCIDGDQDFCLEIVSIKCVWMLISAAWNIHLTWQIYLRIIWTNNAESWERKCALNCSNLRWNHLHLTDHDCAFSCKALSYLTYLQCCLAIVKEASTVPVAGMRCQQPLKLEMKS